MEKNKFLNQLIKSLASDNWILKREGSFDVKAYYHNRDKNISIFPQGLFIYCVAVIDRDNNLKAKKRYDRSVVLYPNLGLKLWIMLQTLDIPDVKEVKSDRTIDNLTDILKNKTP